MLLLSCDETNIPALLIMRLLAEYTSLRSSWVFIMIVPVDTMKLITLSAVQLKTIGARFATRANYLALMHIYHAFKVVFSQFGGCVR